MMLTLGETGNFIFGKHEFGFSVEIGIARSTELWYYQVRSVNAGGTWSNVVLNDNCKSFDEAYRKAKDSLSIFQLPRPVSIEFYGVEVMHMCREKFEPINWEEELA